MDNQKLRIWWIPQIPMNPMYIHVKTLEEAAYVLNLLAFYDDFQFKNKVKPDYSNVGGLQMFDENDKDWCDWYDEDGLDFDDWMGENGKDYVDWQKERKSVL